LTFNSFAPTVAPGSTWIEEQGLRAVKGRGKIGLKIGQIFEWPPRTISIPYSFTSDNITSLGQTIYGTAVVKAVSKTNPNLLGNALDAAGYVLPVIKEYPQVFGGLSSVAALLTDGVPSVLDWISLQINTDKTVETVEITWK
jgi:hypothetical protein